MDRKLIIPMIGDNCSEYIPMCFDSIIDYADKIVFVWGMEDIKTKEIILEYQKKYPDKIILIERKYEHELPDANSRARSYYLEYLKEKYLEDYALCLDPDEVVENAKIIKTLLKRLDEIDKDILISPKMRHLIYTLNREDTTFEKHFCPHRFFRISKSLFYSEGEHPVLFSKTKNPLDIQIEDFCIWHLSYIKNVFDVRKKYLNHLEKSEMHTQEFIEDWYRRHIFGEYATKTFNPLELPKEILNYFKLDNLAEELYFKNRKSLEIKHFLTALIIKQHFSEAKTVLDIGCGAGQLLYALQSFGFDAEGIDKSNYILTHTPFKHLYLQEAIWQQDIVDKSTSKKYNLVICYDIIEHIDYENLDKAINNIYESGNKDFIFSIPVIGNPNLDDDPTHKIKETKEWWLRKLSRDYIDILITPRYFPYHQQIILARRKK